jgi:hypothetical protein
VQLLSNQVNMYRMMEYRILDKGAHHFDLRSRTCLSYRIANINPKPPRSSDLSMNSAAAVLTMDNTADLGITAKTSPLPHQKRCRKLVGDSVGAINEVASHKASRSVRSCLHGNARMYSR